MEGTTDPFQDARTPGPNHRCSHCCAGGTPSFLRGERTGDPAAQGRHMLGRAPYDLRADGKCRMHRKTVIHPLSDPQAPGPLHVSSALNASFPSLPASAPVLRPPPPWVGPQRPHTDPSFSSIVRGGHRMRGHCCTPLPRTSLGTQYTLP